MRRPIAVSNRTREPSSWGTPACAPATTGSWTRRLITPSVSQAVCPGDCLLARVLFGVTTSDAAALGTAGAFLLLAALVACVPPALKAMRVDPVQGLRTE